MDVKAIKQAIYRRGSLIEEMDMIEQDMNRALTVCVLVLAGPPLESDVEQFTDIIAYHIGKSVSRMAQTKELIEEWWPAVELPVIADEALPWNDDEELGKNEGC